MPLDSSSWQIKETGRQDTTYQVTIGELRSLEETVRYCRMNLANEDVASAVRGTKVKILDITSMTQLRDEAHVSCNKTGDNDCLHWCLPGVPDTWNELLVAQREAPPAGLQLPAMFIII
ncbi:PC-Esterase [Corchorus olitorius]|uniref:PC-Esterase n=1 Tax=Corchorus olitorius TaxID=93759 RepID=A0A1R3GDA4_9ROSI|nr:PC-Esterase [Corchorus olitorius]